MSKVRPKKHLGQHFLIDENIARKIVDSISQEDDRNIIEVGPGTGVLTQHLITHPKFSALDVDKESVEYLKRIYPAHSDKIVLKDFLHQDLGEEKVNVIGNFPYNISSQIFFKIYESRQVVDEVVCMIQKEVADRIAAHEGNKTYGILSVLLQAFFKVEYLFTVKPGVFNPPPKVNSAVIRLKRNTIERLDCDERMFKRVVKAGFGKRRKTLRNALKELNLPQELTVNEVFDKRAEQLSVNDFIHLTSKITNS
ncbi:MAG: 16S rRNA (adenine(1518)-N(6)/adenine(1519)-N(6))-dimethyltransferase RsmA [Cyclobacteriaceae bacterium]